MLMETGLCVLHLFCSADRPVVARDVERVIADAASHDCQVVSTAMLGHKAQYGFMVLGADVARVRDVQIGLAQAGLSIDDSYLSITEVNEYATGIPDEMLRHRLYPQLPPADKPAFCFYPMSKRRAAHANWYTMGFDERNALMHEHGTSGRAFAGKIVQLITASTGLDMYEWGVTLFGLNLDVIKDVVHTMRFDTASALYGEFGDFFVGYIAAPAELFPADSATS